MFLNTSIIYDLKLVIENPFQSSEKRVAKFLVYSVLLGIIFAYINLKLTSSTNYRVAALNSQLY